MGLINRNGPSGTLSSMQEASYPAADADPFSPVYDALVDHASVLSDHADMLNDHADRLAALEGPEPDADEGPGQADYDFDND